MKKWFLISILFIALILSSCDVNVTINATIETDIESTGSTEDEKPAVEEITETEDEENLIEDFELVIPEDEYTVSFAIDGAFFVYTHDGEKVTDEVIYYLKDTKVSAKEEALETLDEMEKDPMIGEIYASVESKGKYVVVTLNEAYFNYHTTAELLEAVELYSIPEEFPIR